MNIILTHKTHIFGNTILGHVGAHFMHVSTAAAGLGDSAWLETPRMMPSGTCHVQCLQFYFFHSGNPTDQLNIWLREFQSESDLTGTNRLVKQITGNFGNNCISHHLLCNVKQYDTVTMVLLFQATEQLTGK